VPYLDITVGLIAQAWFDDASGVQVALTVPNSAEAVALVVEEHRLMG
jgi:hypothetical protein